jgi:hypothetical protein
VSPDRPTRDVETLLRETLAVDASTAVPYGSWPEDPWVRVERAHRQGRARRRAGVAALLVAVVAAAGGVAAGLDGDRRPPQPAHTDSPSDTWEALDDGRTRGEPVDEAMSADVLRALAAPRKSERSFRLTDPSTLRFLWNGNLGGRRIALVGATLEDQYGARLPRASWVGQPAPGEPVQVLRQWGGGPAVATIPYRDGDGRMRLLAVVRRDATVWTSRATILGDGPVERHWESVEGATDGDIDVDLGEGLTYAPLELRVDVPGRARQYTSVAEWGARIGTGGTAAAVTDEDVTRAAAGARGDLSPAGVRSDVKRALELLMDQMVSDPAHTNPAVIGAWSAGPGRAVVVVSAGYRAQGRLLSIRMLGGDGGFGWWYDTTVPLSPVAGLDQPVTWRVPLPFGDGSRHVTGWLLPGAGGWSQPQVTVNGAPARDVTVLDGLGFVEVGAHDAVRVTATYGDGIVLDETLEPGDAEPAFDPARYDPFPPGADR